VPWFDPDSYRDRRGSKSGDNFTALFLGP